MKSQHVKCVEVLCQSKLHFPLSLPRSHGQLKLWKELYTRTPQDICNYASVFYGVKGIKKSSSDFKDLAYWDLETITSMIHYIIHELHPTDVKVIFDLDENPEKGNYLLVESQTSSRNGGSSAVAVVEGEGIATGGGAVTTTTAIGGAWRGNGGCWSPR